MDAAAHYRKAHLALAPAAGWLDRARAHGLERLEATGFPGRKDEAWKYTNAAQLLREPFAPKEPGELSELPTRAVATEGPTLVWVDGRFHPGLSRLEDLPKGLSLRPLSAADDGVDPKVGELFDELSGFDALNAAFLADGAVIEVAAGAAVAEPVHLVHISTGGERLNALRVLVRTGKNSQATVVEHWLGEGRALTTAVTELQLEANSELTHIRVNDEDPGAGLHVGTVVSRQARDSRLRSWVITLGAAISRVAVRSELAGEGAEVALNGLYLLRGKQHADHYTWIDHAEPHTNSTEHYKGILDGSSRGVFTGRIVVQPDAQKIDSAQTNHNLLLSDSAVANTRPQLEIFADDVKCSHGATIGRIDSESAFYLQSRGLSPEEAQGLLTFAFANDVLARLAEGPVRASLEARVKAWLEDA